MAKVKQSRTGHGSILPPAPRARRAGLLLPPPPTAGRLPPPPPGRGRPAKTSVVAETSVTGDLWNDIVGHSYRHQDVAILEKRAGVVAARDALFQHWSLHPWNWLSGRDTDGRPIIWTKLEGEIGAASVQAYPAHLAYLRLFVEDLHTVTPDTPILLDKARQMMVTWNCLLYMDWECRFNPHRRWLLSKSTEDEAYALIEEKLDFVNANLPYWVRERSPYLHSPRLYAKYPKTGSFIKAVAKTAGERETRGGTASGILIDEAARQENFKKIWQGAVPMATKIFAVTTADIGTPGARFFANLIGKSDTL